MIIWSCLFKDHQILRELTFLFSFIAPFLFFGQVYGFADLCTFFYLIQFWFHIFSWIWSHFDSIFFPPVLVNFWFHIWSPTLDNGGHTMAGVSLIRNYIPCPHGLPHSYHGHNYSVDHFRPWKWSPKIKRRNSWIRNCPLPPNIQLLVLRPQNPPRAGAAVYPEIMPNRSSLRLMDHSLIETINMIVPNLIWASSERVWQWAWRLKRHSWTCLTHGGNVALWYNLTSVAAGWHCIAKTWPFWIHVIALYKGL